MDAHKALIADIFNSSTQLEIPFFQRAYVWQEDLWERFENDMEFVTETDKPHFFGSIILKEGEPPKKGDNFTARKTVVDGQQRLTTFLIFLKVLCLKTGQKLFDTQFRVYGEQIALRAGRNDSPAFEKAMAMKKAEEIDNPQPQSRVISAFNYFVKHADPNKLDVLRIMKNVQFVKIDLTTDEDEQQIFDTINSLGVNLTTSELLKNYFFSRETVNEYVDKWEQVFEKDDETKAYWDTEIETGRMKRALIDIFFDAFFQQFIQDKQYNVSTEDKILYARVDKIAQSYQQFIKMYCKGDKTVILDNLKDYADCFRKTFDPKYCYMAIPKEFGVERMNVLIFGLKNTTMIPYVLYVVKNVSDPQELTKIYHVLESYVMRRMITHVSTKNYNNLFTLLIRNQALDADSLLKRLEDSKETTTYVPTDAEVENGFQNSHLTNLQTRGILYLIESYIRSDKSATALQGFNNYSLEHMMPKKWRNNWPPCATEEEAKERDSKLLTLGNLAIIPQALNSSIRDGDWQTKKAGKGESKPGLDACAVGLATIQDALKENEWTEESIEKRGEWLACQAEKAWKI
ncbi:DUF262 domain-containing protein [Oribacterium sp. HCP28S3_H8]|uniref:DUF262 domain-containing protein n=1 Tax=Oribacterium sp. HCP28S3_H8 TaxID=3438945 RepID=UPI003F8AEDC9